MKEEYIQKGFITTTGDKHSYTLKNLFKKYLKYFGVLFSDPCCYDDSFRGNTYKSYVALLNYSVDEITANVLHNTIGNLTWVVDGTGSFHVESEGLFTTDKTWCTISNSSTNTYAVFVLNNVNRIDLYTILDGDAESVLNNNSIEIRIYN